MRLFFFFFLSFLLLLPQKGNAYECPPYKDPTIILNPIVTTPQINHKLPLSELMNKAGSAGASEKFSSRHQRPVGLTAASLGLTAHYDITTQRYPQYNQSCSQIKSLTLQYGYDDTIVYMAQELPFRSCAYQEVLDHELRHVATDRRILDMYASYLENIFLQTVRDIGMVRTRTDEEGKKIISQRINAVITQTSARMSKTRRDEQMKIDTDEEYKRLSKVCRGSLPKIIRKALREERRR